MHYKFEEEAEQRSGRSDTAGQNKSGIRSPTKEKRLGENALGGKVRTVRWSSYVSIGPDARSISSHQPTHVVEGERQRQEEQGHESKQRGTPIDLEVDEQPVSGEGHSGTEGTPDEVVLSLPMRR